LEALEDEERREAGGMEVVRPIMLIREGGSQAESWGRSRPATVLSVFALE
jgi:hypothetical protein